MIHKTTHLMFLLVVLVVALCTSPCGATDTWTTVIPGVKHLHRVTSAPLNIDVLLVDLTNPRVRLRTGIKNDNDKSDGGETVNSECRRYNAVAGINCDFFSFTAPYAHCPQGITITDGLSLIPVGSPGIIVSGRTGIAIPADNSYAVVSIFTNVGSWMYNVASGGPRIITNGVGYVAGSGYNEPGLPTDMDVLNPRTGVAVTSDWHTLIIATVDGRQAGFSIGVTDAQLATLLIGPFTPPGGGSYSGYQGVGYDSGGSTTMVINGTTINSPSDGSDRLVANCLMVMDKLRQESNPTVSFEGYFENPPYAVGTLGGTNGWIGAGNVVTGGHTGSLCAHLKSGSASRDISTSSLTGVQWVDCWVKTSSTNSNANIYTGTSALSSAAGVVKFTSGGQIQACDTDASGNHIWTNIGTYAANTWYNVRLRLDYNINSYQALVNGALVISGAAFLNSAASSGLQAIKFEEVGGASDFYMDDIYVGNVDPNYVRVSPDSTLIVQGGTRQFSALGGTTPVTWSVVNELNSSGGSVTPGTVAQISSTGVLTAKSAGTCRIQVQDNIGRVDQSSVITLLPSRSIHDIKTLADGANVGASGLIVTGVYNGFIYAEEPNRLSGVKIITTVNVSEETQILVAGTTSTVGGERVINASWLQVSP